MSSPILSGTELSADGDRADRYWTDLVKRLHPYVPGEQPRERQYIKLNTNENPYGPSPRVIAAMQAAITDDLRLYPDPEAQALRQAIADQQGVGVDNVFAGNGSDEVLALAFQAFFTDGRALLFPDISYSFYPVYCNLYNIEARPVPLAADFTLNTENYTEPGAGIIFPNPNAPTSKALPLTEITRLLQRHRDAVVIVDEAYVDFGAETAVPLCADYPNLLVTRTLSKSGSLAGMRVGYAIGNSGLIQALTRVKDSFNSYPLDRMAQVAAQAAIEDTDYFQTICEKIIAVREKSTTELRALGFEVLESAANFLFVTHPEHGAVELAASLRADGILVRHFAAPRIDQYLRITVGTEDEMTRLVSTLQRILD